jgi:hypothetical protein
MPPVTPYSHHLAGRDPIEAMRDTSERLERLTSGWSAEQFERRADPDKWSARQQFIHLAQTELALGARARMALTTPQYTAQPFDQDKWISRESGLGGSEAVAAFRAVARMNAALFESLSSADREVVLSHPEYGTLTVDWIIHRMAGHQIHHLRQLEAIARA